MTRLEEIRNSLPKYRLLTPGIDKWKEGDEADECGWTELSKDAEGIGALMEIGEKGHRPYSEAYLNSMAFWIRLQEWFNITGLDSILPESLVSELGGDERIIAEFNKGFDWLRENLP